MRELDQLLTGYLDHRWETAPDAERRVFLQLLDCEDDRLWRWFTGRESPTDDAFESLVQRIRTPPD